MLHLRFKVVKKVCNKFKNSLNKTIIYCFFNTEKLPASSVDNFVKRYEKKKLSLESDKGDINVL